MLLYRTGKAFASGGEVDVKEGLKKMDKATVERNKKQFSFYARLSLFVFAAILAFVVYKLYEEEFFAALCCFVVSLIPLINAVKYHYWYKILEQKKLLTVKKYFEGLRTRFK